MLVPIERGEKLMKLKFILTFLLAFCIFASSAEASYFLPYSLAKRENDQFAKQICAKERQCTGWGSRCERITRSRIDCIAADFSEGYEPGEELECTIPMHWGVSYRGYVQLKRHGSPRCFSI
jgi:hypothetical protein